MSTQRFFIALNKLRTVHQFAKDQDITHKYEDLPPTMDDVEHHIVSLMSTDEARVYLREIPFYNLHADEGPGWFALRTGWDNEPGAVRRGKHIDELPHETSRIIRALSRRAGLDVDWDYAQINPALEASGVQEAER